MTELPKTFDPAAIETRWYEHWEANGLFRPERPGAEPWTIVNPPPNVTGSLHIGHALDNTLQDILARHARLQGKDAMWVVGVDHAGIATQMVVERQMGANGEKRTDYTRDEFVAKVWEWKAESGGQITRQLRRLGCSMDWSNERFTMDEGFSKAVLKVFVELHRQGLLYRDKRLVNWDPGLGTAISDLEVETKEVQGKFWHLSYPLADGSGTISVATTRPETMLADMAIAVNPSDERYTALVGKEVRLPITGRLIPIVADEHADPELGSGAVKITPGHDFNDFEVGKRAGIAARDMLNMLDAKAQVIQTADGLIPDQLIGLDRAEARKRVVELLEEAGVLEQVEDRVIQTPYGDRSGVVIEPWLTDQWYVDAATLAKPAIEAVRDGRIRMVPKSWEKTFFNWMENIQPWCVSRQLWWGHQIPAWFADDGRIFVAETEAEAQAEAGEGVTLTRDPDVLDTWFSSALWPFATMGWPENANPSPSGEGQGVGDASQRGVSAALPHPNPSPEGEGRSVAEWQRRYPNDVLISGFDILFFWDARMMMQGMHFLKDVPFRTLYLHGLVRAADGQKMSKSKGNTVDPLGLIERYGADALRFFMAAMESQGRDIKMDEKRVEGYRNFATKLWNAARFCQANGIGGSTTLEPPAAASAVNKWIVAETVRTIQGIDLALADYRFDAAANAIYQFVWSRFCDWYLELIKGQIDAETTAVAGWVLDQILVLLHPFMPFITEELWHAMAPRNHDLIVARWPMADARSLDSAAEAEVDWLIRLVGEIRAARTELNVPPGARLPLHVRDAGAETTARLARQAPVLARMARVDQAAGDASGGAAQVVVDEATFVLPLEGVIDLDAERARLTKAIAAAEKERDSLAGRLGNPSFVERAKPEAVEKAKADHAEKTSEAERLSAALARLG
ncbi:valyl-tRNA synthetase [Sphingomonas jinjuensis]|uniref:Valine--tRNA ligase n=1 Tax=Sphingomonas jinjuensis TaxID=535907 RepID=A0A840F5A5_9SPHN|nr:valine--tRNA ligase [Sphingomonas jinjuensis]MBB4153090.1 valyl-tRNA synthetase [Sphingomonas jinjuensis]